MSQSYTNYFTYATSRPSPLQIAFWSGKYRGHPVGKHDECRVGGRPLGQSDTLPCGDDGVESRTTWGDDGRTMTRD